MGPIAARFLEGICLTLGLRACAVFLEFFAILIRKANRSCPLQCESNGAKEGSSSVQSGYVPGSFFLLTDWSIVSQVTKGWPVRRIA